MTIKFTPRGEKGWPDRLFISPWGVHVWMEFKRKGKKPRKLQAARLKQLRTNRAHALWVDNYNQAIEALEYYE